jgi:hypothetical protein
MIASAAKLQKIKLRLSAFSLAGSGPSAEFVLVQVHADALAAEGDTLALQPHLLFEAGFAGEADVAAGAKDAVPRKSARRSQRPHDLASCTGKSGGRRNLAVGRDLALGNLQNNGADLGKHAFSIIEARRMKRCPSCSIAITM